MKTCVFCFDGTGNEPSRVEDFHRDESITNILKLHILMGGSMDPTKNGPKTAAGDPQQTYYYNGIGTRIDGISVPLLGRIHGSLTRPSHRRLATPGGF